MQAGIQSWLRDTDRYDLHAQWVIIKAKQHTVTPSAVHTHTHTLSLFLFLFPQLPLSLSTLPPSVSSFFCLSLTHKHAHPHTHTQPPLHECVIPLRPFVSLCHLALSYLSALLSLSLALIFLSHTQTHSLSVCAAVSPSCSFPVCLSVTVSHDICYLSLRGRLLRQTKAS